MNEQQERELEQNLTVIARKLAAKDREIAALQSMVRLQSALNDLLAAEIRRLVAPPDQSHQVPGEMGHERRN